MNLAIETIVITTLALIFLAFGIYFVRTGFSSSYDWLEEIDQQLKAQLLVQCESEYKKIFIHKRHYERSETTFAAIKNLGSDDEFTLNMLEVSGKDVTISDWFNFRKDPILISSGECALVGINLDIPASAESGSYIFDLKITNTDGVYAGSEFIVTKK